ncbi:hypothetical protein HOY81_15170 [Streptomyces sp. JJ36]|nr:hypothetical protein [Streptomyces sp. JJ36]
MRQVASVNSRPRHARDTSPRRAPALLRFGLTLSAAGAALAAGGTAASAAEPSRVATPLGTADTDLVHDPSGAVQDAVTYGVGSAYLTLTRMQLDPLSGTGSDPLDNGLGTQVADFPAVGTQQLTGPVADGASLRELPLTRGLLP